MAGGRLGRAVLAAVTVACVTLSAALVAPGQAAGEPGGSEPTPGAEAVRVLIVGDSVTHGSSGDWTWRYRLWHHLVDSGVDVDFVGPRRDLWNLRTDAAGATSYADPAFDQDHAAKWGMWAAFPDVPFDVLAADTAADVVVVMLGAIDLVWTDEPASTVVDRMRQIVTEVRRGRPGAHVVLAQATQRWFDGVPEFNAGLDDVAAELSEPGSRVVVAATARDYDLAGDTWDGSHANARGEVRIAAAVADALASAGVGPPSPRPLVLPPVGPVQTPSLSAVGGDGRATLAWVGPDAATSHRLWSRDVTARAPWSVHAEGLPRDGDRAVAGLRNGHRYEFRLQPVKGDDLPETGVYSPTVAVVPAAVALPPARPPALSKVRSLRASAGRRCVRLTWARVPHATAYRVQRFSGGRWRGGTRTKHNRVTLKKLPAAKAWRFRVRAVRGDRSGPSKVIRVVRRAGRC
ncbi:hypothetical protein KG112_16390 [Nocardioides sp. zg-ZUI104]|uniref:GDSL-type esterase/lipase family protein n=1 Tax=Nocardioides faecalis TaxID=2803858 RepID=UPI001BCD380A|nr:GDSL-type esterase/lipase family protein [Nocardioides faecalis]MBS4754388.1 hypothetical protein [Nocardioides faecalis]